MTTIFIKNLKELIAGQLKIRWSALNSQSTAYDIGPFKLSGLVHDTTLSVEQGDAISKLETKIITFEGTGNDEEDKNTIKGLIATAKKEIERVRVDHDAKATSDTLSCLEKVSNAAENFYMHLQEIPFPLLNLAYKETPEYIVYSHACHYLGLAKFQPDSHCSIEIRTRKEEALFVRLDLLKKAIRPGYTFEQQKEVTLQALSDLDRDNNDIVKPKKAVTVPLVSAGFSLFGMPVKAQTSSPGTLEKEIALAIKEIMTMTPETSQCHKAKPASVIPSLVKASAKEDHEPAKVKPSVKPVAVTSQDDVEYAEEDLDEDDEVALDASHRSTSP